MKTIDLIVDGLQHPQESVYTRILPLAEINNKWYNYKDGCATYRSYLASSIRNKLFKYR